MKLKRLILIFVIYFILIIYLLELSVLVFLNKEHNLIDHNMDELKLMATKKIKNFDKRSDFLAFQQLKLEHENLSPSFRISEKHLFRGDYKNHIKNFYNSKIENDDKIPFRGPINKISLGSNEDGYREIINNDKFGFKNSNKIYDKKINIIVVGDSFAEGIPFGNENNIASQITSNSKMNALNLGIGGTGPLTSYATIKEYGENFQPETILYLFYEGNDLDDLMIENKTFLNRYLSLKYSQGLFESTEELKVFLDEYEEVFNKILPMKVQQENIKPKKILKNEPKYLESISDFLELQSLKNLLFYSSTFNKQKVNFNLFEKVLKNMKITTKKWGGNLYFVYLPSWSRYNTNNFISNYFLKNKIRKIVEKNKIFFIDVDKIFKKNRVNNINSYNLGIYGHYTKEIYNLISKELVKIIN